MQHVDVEQRLIQIFFPIIFPLIMRTEQTRNSSLSDWIRPDIINNIKLRTGEFRTRRWNVGQFG